MMLKPSKISLGSYEVVNIKYQSRCANEEQRAREAWCHDLITTAQEISLWTCSEFMSSFGHTALRTQDCTFNIYQEFVFHFCRSGHLQRRAIFLAVFFPISKMDKDFTSSESTSAICESVAWMCHYFLLPAAYWSTRGGHSWRVPSL